MTTRLHRTISLFIVLSISTDARPSLAQRIILKTGQTIETKGIRRNGDIVMAKIEAGSGRGEVGYQTSTIARIDFPKPAQLTTTATLLAEGDPTKALAEIGPVAKYYEQFRDIPGNWWAQAALLEVSALAGMQLDKEAETLGAQIRRNVTDPEMARAAQLQLVPGLIRSESYDKALQHCDAVLKESNEREGVAEAWVRKGDVFLAQRQWQSAVFAYLHVPVFCQDEKLWLAPALLGSARAFRALGESECAKKSLSELVTEFPGSPQAGAAQAELKKLPK
jgi:tetratricopeptide (TPR) repeat protein